MIILFWGWAYSTFYSMYYLRFNHVSAVIFVINSTGSKLKEFSSTLVQVKSCLAMNSMTKTMIFATKSRFEPVELFGWAYNTFSAISKILQKTLPYSTYYMTVRHCTATSPVDRVRILTRWFAQKILFVNLTRYFARKFTIL